MLTKELAEKYGEKAFHKKNTRLKISVNNGLFYICSGFVKLLYEQKKGQVIAIDIYKRNEFFGYFNSENLPGQCKMELIFLEDTELIFIDYQTIHHHSIMDNRLRVDFLRIIKTLLQESLLRFFILSVLKKSEIILHMLYYLASKFGTDLKNGKTLVTVKLTDLDFKELCNTTREKVSRTMASLRKDGIVERKNGHLIISSKEDINKRLSHNYLAL